MSDHPLSPAPSAGEATGPTWLNGAQQFCEADAELFRRAARMFDAAVPPSGGSLPETALRLHRAHHRANERIDGCEYCKALPPLPVSLAGAIPPTDVSDETRAPQILKPALADERVYAQFVDTFTAYIVAELKGLRDNPNPWFARDVEKLRQDAAFHFRRAVTRQVNRVLIAQEEDHGK